MIPKEKAVELLRNYLCGVDEYGFQLCHFNSCARKCALIAAEETMMNTQPADSAHLQYWIDTGFTGYRQFWEQVITEIELL